MTFQEFCKNCLYINGTTISTVFVLPSAGAVPDLLILDLNDSDCVILSFGSSL